MPVSRDSCRRIFQYEREHPEVSTIEISKATDLARSSIYNCRYRYNKEDLLENPSEKISKQEKQKITTRTKDNEMVATSKSSRVKTIDDLIEEAEIDLDTWEIEQYEENKWDAQRSGGEVIEMYKVEARLTKRVLDEKEFEPVKPLSVHSSYSQLSKPTPNRALKKAVIIPDVHIGYRRDSYTQEMQPFHDRRALDLALQLIEYIKPDLVIQLGDFLDMPEWSKKFIRSPECSRIMQASGNEGLWWLMQIRQLIPNAEIIWIEGNHGERLPHFLKQAHKAAYGLKPAQSVKEDPDLLSMERFMRLNELDITYSDGYPDNQFWVNDSLIAEHGEKTSSVKGKSAGQVLKDAEVSHIFGHSHCLEMATKTTYPEEESKLLQSACLGCLCRLGGLTPGKKKKQDWQNALSVIDYEKNDSVFYIHPILIQDGHMIYDGKSFEGENRLEQIKEEAKVEQYNFVEFNN